MRNDAEEAELLSRYVDNDRALLQKIPIRPSDKLTRLAPSAGLLRSLNRLVCCG